MSSRRTSNSSPSPRPSSPQRTQQQPKRLLRACIEEYLLDHQSQNHSPKTLEWHSLSLGNLADFLEKQGVTTLEDIERVHILS